MPTLCIEKGALVVVTGVNGLIGSHTADQLLRLGYAVRGVVRDVKKNEWLIKLFDERHPGARFELVEVPDMTIEGCYDASVQGAAGFIHIASPLGGFDHAPTAIQNGIDASLTALKSCAKSPSVKRFAWTSSSLAATNPHPNKEFSIDETSYNEEAIAAVTEDPKIKGFSIYSAMKAQTERAMWKWMDENKPQFVLNTILPNANFGALLAPEQQGFPSTIAWARAAWTGELFTEHATFILPQWYISPEDSALLHIAAILYEEIQSERLFGFAEPWNYNDMLAVFRAAYPDRTFPSDVEGMGEDKMKVTNEKAEEVLKWVKGKGWDKFDDSVREMSAGWAKE